MLRLHLPPNLTAAAPRDAIAIKVELDPAASSEALATAGLLPALALLQRWCGTATPPKFIQLNRTQLRELVNAVGDRPVFIENGELTIWRHAALLAEPAANCSSERGQVDSPRPVTSNSRSGERERANVESRGPRSSPIPANSTPMTVDGSEHYLAITLPSRENPTYAAALELVKTNGFVLEPSNRKWWLRDRHKTLNFLAAHSAPLRATFAATFTPNFERNTNRLLPAEIACVAIETGGDFNVTIALRAGSASDDVLRSALAANRGYVESDGRIFLLDAAKLRRLDAAQRALAGTPSGGPVTRRTHRVNPARMPEAQEILETLSPDFQPPDTWRTRSEGLRNLSRLTSAPLPRGLESQLRPYQRLGAAWLWHLHRHELGGILADEMGLGKTLQALALLSAVHAEIPNPNPQSTNSKPKTQNPEPQTPNPKPKTQNPKPRTPSLVVCPASLLENWRRESARFAPQLRVFVHHGDQRLAFAADSAAHDVVITSYGTLARDWELFAKITFATVIADEAQHIKNRRSQNAAALRSLRAHSRFLLTGTPVENSFDDLRSLFEFLLPGYIDKIPAGTRAEERTWFDDRLRAKVAPYILRRTKQAVAPELPAKLEQIIWCEFTPAQAAVYRAMQERTERELFDLEAGGASESKIRFAALTQLLRLRQICCDPRLVLKPGMAASVSEPTTNGSLTLAATDESEKLSVASSNGPTGVADASGGTVSPYPNSAKLDAFRELLAEAIDDGHRILVFSQFTSLLALLRDELVAQQTAYCYLDGSMSPRARQSEVDRFQATADVPIFLISLKSGGTGLNLTGADTVIHFDPWWNPAAEAQATDRAHRIGQTRAVTSYKLIASGSVEEKVLALQDEKRALLAGVFEASDAAAANLSLADLKSLLL